MYSEDLELKFFPLTSDRWKDFEVLFGPKGACGGCWCMWWRLTKTQFDVQKGEKNKQGMKAIVDAGQVPGILAYHQGRPIGWCSVAPREEFTRLERSRILKPIDNKKVWSVVCFYIAKDYRGKGVATRLLEAAVKFVYEKKGRIIEGYPVEPKKVRIPDLFAYHGTWSLFNSVGFREVARRSETRPIMRFYV